MISGEHELWLAAMAEGRRRADAAPALMFGELAARLNRSLRAIAAAGIPAAEACAGLHASVERLEALHTERVAAQMRAIAAAGEVLQRHLTARGGAPRGARP